LSKMQDRKCRKKRSGNGYGLFNMRILKVFLFSSTLQLVLEFTRYKSMRLSFFCPLVAVLCFFFCSCENRYRNRGQIAPAQQGSPSVKKSSSKQVQLEGLSKDAYQVTASEFDEFFIYRYGLLYQKFSDTPFSGRVVTTDKGEQGDFVSLDEGWLDGKKHGVSTRWFSNGIKMYERHYNEGRWHGTVTRWWPNGQKMYVRAYTEGKRHGKEATWRSDGTPIEISSSEPSEVRTSPSILQDTANQSDDLPSVSIPESTSVTEPEFDTEPNTFAPVDPASSFEPLGSPTEPEMLDSLPSFEPLDESVEASSPDSDLGLPPLSPSDDVEMSDGNDLPAFPAESLPEPDAPELPDTDSSEGLPPMPVTEEAAPVEGLPPLMEEPSAGSADLPPLSDDALDGLPPLPGGGGLPPLPENGDLPPLPGGGDLPPLHGDGGLPPLPALP